LRGVRLVLLLGDRRSLLEVLLEPHGAVEDADNMNYLVRTNEVHDPVVTPEENAQVTTRGTSVGVAKPAGIARGPGPAGRWT
jgi:hypothetical protein